MSVPSSKSTVMSTSAFFDRLRRMVWCGMPSSSVSTGWVMRPSTSSGVMPGAFRISLTCVDETSGKASIGISWNARTPSPASTSASTSTNQRRASANSVRIFNNTSLSQPLRLERRHASYGNAAARGEAADFRLAGVLANQLHLRRREALRGFDKHIGHVDLPYQRGGWHGQCPGSMRAGDGGLHRLAGPQDALGIGEAGACQHALRRTELGQQGGDAAAGGTARHGDRLSDGNLARLRRREWNLQSQLRQVCQL